MDAPSPSKSQAESDAQDSARGALVRLHFRAGWWSLLLFLTLGVGLEALHAFKAGIYLDVSNETRRLMWTLAHAHGTLLALVHLAFGVTVALVPSWNRGPRRAASASLLAAGLLVPLGFFLGGAAIHEGDPGLGIVLVPPGALLLIIAVFLTARGSAAPGAEGIQPDSIGRTGK